MATQADWPLPSPRAGEPDLRWVLEDNRVAALHWDGALLPPESPLFKLGGFPTSDRGAPFPIQFRFDPATGAKLTPATDDGPLASHPGHLHDGFPAILSQVKLQEDTARERSAIPPGTVGIFCAGRPRRIFALTANGNLFFRSALDAWTELPKLPPPPLELHTFGVCAFETGFATVLGNEAVIARLTAGIPELQITTTALAGAVFCGPPASIENDVLVFPILRGSSLSLARYAIVSEQWDDELPVEGTAGEIGAGFAPPVQNTSRVPDTFWITGAGYIKLTSAYGGRHATALRLPEGLTAIQGAPALRDERDTLHALVRSTTHYAFLALSGRHPQIPLDGPSLSVGRGRYFGRQYYPSSTTADPITLNIDAGTDRVLLPLAYGVSERGETDGALLLLAPGVKDIQKLFMGQSSDEVSGALYWHKGSQLRPLGITLKFSSRHDLLIYRDTDYLYVGSSRKGDVYRVKVQC